MSHHGKDYFESVRTRREPIDAAAASLVNLTKSAAAGGIVLLLTTVAALVLANAVPEVAHAFHDFWTGSRLSITIGSWTFPAGKHAGHLEWWVNDALMAAFFFVIGLEIKREVLAGELKEPRKAALPLIAAVGGMILPGLIYAALNWGEPTIRGWAIPAATDIAFALGVLALLGKRVPPGLRVFLVTLAIADDLGALLIIAFFYTDSEQLKPLMLGYAFITMGVMCILNLLGVRRWWVYGIAGLALWYFVLESGVHPTIAGVIGAMTIPVRTRIDGEEFSRQARRFADEFERDRTAGGMILTSPAQQGVLHAMEQLTEAAQPPLLRLEKGMAPLAAFLVVPLFALANAGVPVGGMADQAVRAPEAQGIVLGLIVGKTLGIFGFALLAVKFDFSVLPSGVTWRHMLGAALLGGIGFTMSLFIANLAFAGGMEGGAAHLETAKLAVLAGSALSAILGAVVLATCTPAAANQR